MENSEQRNIFASHNLSLLHYFNMKLDWITDLNPYFFGNVHFCFDIVYHFLINFNENASEILTAGIYVIAATQKIHNHGRYGQDVGVATVDLY